MLIGLQAPGIHRNVVLDHHAEGIEHGGPRHRLRRVEIVLHDRRRAGEIDRRLALFAVDADLDLDGLAGVGRVFVSGAVRQAIQHAPHTFGGIVLHMAHIGFDDVEAEMLDHLAQLGDALFIGGDLRLQVGDVLLRVAGRVGVVGEQGLQFRLAEPAALDQTEIVEQNAFFIDRGCQRRHRSGRRAADIGVMAARRDPEEDLWRPAAPSTMLRTIPLPRKRGRISVALGRSGRSSPAKRGRGTAEGGGGDVRGIDPTRPLRGHPPLKGADSASRTPASPP